MDNLNPKPKKGFFSGENLTSGALTALIIATVIALNVIIFVIASRLGLSFTAKEKDELVLTGSTDSLFEEVIADRKTVKISFCFSSKEEIEADTMGAFVHKTALEFAKRYDFLEIEYINLLTKKNHKGENVDVKKYETDMKGNRNYISKASVIFECGNNYRVVTDTLTSAGFVDFYIIDSMGNAVAYNGEAFMASMIYWVTRDEHPTAYFTLGHSEQTDRTFLNLLTTAGYYIETVDLKTDEVPEDASLLIISNPISDFEKGSGVRTEIERLKTYLERGGNVHVSLDPYVRNMPVFEQFLASYGISFSKTKIDGIELKNIVKDSRNAITTDGFTLVTEFADNGIAADIEKTVRKFSDGNVITRETGALKLSGQAKPLLTTSSSSALEINGKEVDSSGKYCVAAYATVEAGKKDGALLVIPSIYTSVSDSIVTNGYSNRDFFYSVFENLYGENGMPYGCNVVTINVGLLENLTMGSARIYTALILAVPVILALVGTVIVVKRKNR